MTKEDRENLNKNQQKKAATNEPTSQIAQSAAASCNGTQKPQIPFFFRVKLPCQGVVFTYWRRRYNQIF
jgi:hypothetical protein